MSHPSSRIVSFSSAAVVFCSTVVAFFAIELLPTTAIALAQDRSVLESLGATGAVIVGEAVVYSLAESFAGEDLNGDGDTEDAVVHVQTPATGNVTNLGLAGSFGLESWGDHRVSAPWVVFVVSEVAQNADLNGDGDLGEDRNDSGAIEDPWESDHVLHVYNHSTGEVTNLGLAESRATRRVISGRWLGFGVSEASQGRDLNGDGDAEDRVAHVHDLATGETTNLRLAESALYLSENWLVISVPESAQEDTPGADGANAQGEDLNGDDDLGEFVVDRGSERWRPDTVLHAHDLSTGETENLGLCVTGQALRLSGDWLGFAIEEHPGDEDLNNDGDIEDAVVHIQNLSTGVRTNLGLASHHWEFAGDWLLISVPEASQGADLNGDGRIRDGVLHRHQLATGETSNLRVTGWFPRGGSGDWLPLYQAESAANQDLNGDGDTDDVVVHVLVPSTGEIRNLQLTSGGVFLGRFARGPWLAVDVVEWEQGEDLNDDGDRDDVILHLHNISSGETRNLRFMPSRNCLFDFLVVGDWILVTRSSSLGAALYLVSLSTGERIDLGITGCDPVGAIEDRWLVVLKNEHPDDLEMYLVDLDRVSELRTRFRRGDCNDDGTVDISDAVFVLGLLFLGDGAPGCEDACDSNDDGAVDISDAIATLGVLFLGSGAMPPPGMADCGVDPTGETIGCTTSGQCL